jgi:fumarylacetoacetate (FAA) hydrolase
MPMRLATLRNGTPDGELVVVSADATRYLAAPALPNLLAAIENWAVAEPALAALADELATGAGGYSIPRLLARRCRAPGNGSMARPFGTHGDLMQIAFNMPPIETDLPLMYQGMSDRFYGPADPVPFAEPPTASISKASSA